MAENQNKNPLLIVLSGPSGAGKDAVRNQLLESGYPFEFVVTYTTRPRRPQEKEGGDYHFISEKEYDRMLAKGGFMEHAHILGYRYGIPRQPVKESLERGQDVLLRIDIQGAKTVKDLAPQGVFIFLAPSSMEELEARLRLRKTEAGADLERKIATAREEMKALPMFDYVVINRDGALEEAVEKVLAIIQAEKCRVNPRRVDL
ncbi:MAG: guanylate kinase [Chloroflexi bacterium]|nr:guanylate kinase [Chloroflexota bacterium]